MKNLYTERQVNMYMSDSERAEQEIRRKLYSVWRGMKNRCDNTKSPSYPYYGGRGIRVCPSWYVFDNFYQWALDSGYIYQRTSLHDNKNKWSLDRINVNGNYCPENCRWTDSVTQGRNQRASKYLKINGRFYSLDDASEQLCVPKDYIINGIRQGKDFCDLVNTYQGRYQPVTFNITKNEEQEIRKFLNEYRNQNHADIITLDEVMNKLNRGEIKSQDISLYPAKKIKNLPAWIKEILRGDWSCYQELSRDEKNIADNAEFRNLVWKHQELKSDKEKEIIESQIMDKWGVENG